MQPADARLHVFESAGEATRIWIKGEGFTVGKLVGRQLAKRLDLGGCSLVISRCSFVPLPMWHALLRMKNMRFQDHPLRLYTTCAAHILSHDLGL